ncbi:MAG: ABC transporter substrate-binding protein [Ardenticatenales bacterium]
MSISLKRSFAVAAALFLAVGVGACGQPSAPGSESGNGATTPVTDTTAVSDTTGAGNMTAGSKVPADTLVHVSIGEPETLDPAWTYETTGSMFEMALYDSMVFYNREKADDFVPVLATKWQVSDDGLTYTFDIRDGVTFHEGGTLEPHDIAYTLQRGMLQDRVDGPQALFLEPVLGTSSIEGLALERGKVTKDGATIADAPADALIALCEEVQSAVTADDAAKTVTIKLKSATPWLLQLLSQPWGGALDMEWMVQQGDWDGACKNEAGEATWTKWHSPEAQNTVLFNKANGTGPYKLDTWKPGQEIDLVANEKYWRTEPLWAGGPSGVAPLKHIVFQKVDEWATRFAKFQAGEADTVDVPRDQISQVEPMVATTFDGSDESSPSTPGAADGAIELFKGYPVAQMTAAMFTFDINKDSEFIGSGALGDGIPTDFFTDLDVRQGFNYCFDWGTMIRDGLQGEGVQARGPIIEGLMGFGADSPIYTTDLDKCGEHLAKAWGGQVAEKGFKMTLAYNEGNESRKIAAEIIANGLAQVSDKYKVDVQSLEWPSFLEARRLEKFPISISGWSADYMDASNWVAPFMQSSGAYSRAQSFPEAMQAGYDKLIDEGLAESDPAKRDAIYGQLQKAAYDDAIDIFLYQATGRHYQRKEVSGWFNNPLIPEEYYYGLSKQP